MKVGILKPWQSETLTRKHWSKSRKQLIRSRSKAKSFWNPTSLSASYRKPKSGTGQDYRRRRRSPSHASHFAGKPVGKAGKGQRHKGQRTPWSIVRQQGQRISCGSLSPGFESARALQAKNRRHGHWRTKAEISAFVLTSVLTRALFSVVFLEFTYEKRRGRESNPRIAVLQTATLPLGYPAICARNERNVGAQCVNAAKRFVPTNVIRDW